MFDDVVLRLASGRGASVQLERLPNAPASRPRVSVVVPCYKYGHYLEACVQSVLSQDGVDVDVLIVDDASPDDSFEVATAIAAAHPDRVKAVRNAVNLRHIATYNKGLSQATGDYVVLLSADDMLTPGCLARATAVMEADPAVGLVYGNPVVVVGDDVPEARTTARSVGIWSGADWVTAQVRRGLSCIYCPEVVLRTRIQHAVGPYSSSLPHTADLEMWLRVAAVADIARINGADQAYRRMHPASMMQTTHGTVLADLRGRWAAYERFFNGAGAGLPHAARDLQRARRGLAAEALEWVCATVRDGNADPAERADCIAFVEEVYGPATKSLPQWHEYSVLKNERRSQREALALRYRAARRHLAGRMRGYRWRWTGV